jgi:hypothetical protein
MIRWIQEARARTKLRRSIALRRELAKATGMTSVFELARRARVPIDYADLTLELWWIADLVERVTTGHGEPEFRRHVYELTARGRVWIRGEKDQEEAA